MSVALSTALCAPAFAGGYVGANGEDRGDPWGGCLRSLRPRRSGRSGRQGFDLRDAPYGGFRGYRRCWSWCGCGCRRCCLRRLSSFQGEHVEFAETLLERCATARYTGRWHFFACSRVRSIGRSVQESVLGPFCLESAHSEMRAPNFIPENSSRLFKKYIRDSKMKAGARKLLLASRIWCLRTVSGRETF